MTVVELLVVIAILGMLIALILPAVQTARSASRAAMCQSNLRQIVQAIHHYSDALGTLPPGAMLVGDRRYGGSRPPCTAKGFDQSVFVRILPFIDSKSSYDLVNQGLSIHGPENTTLSSKVVSLYACPSDPAATRLLPVGPETSYAFSHSPQLIEAAVRSSYALCYGSLAGFGAVIYYPDCVVPSIRIAQMNGVFNNIAPLQVGDVTDGLSHTMFLADHSFGEDTSQRGGLYGQWVSGAIGDTLFLALLPPNAHQSFADNDRAYEAATSFHPFGVHVAFGDGSVRFVSNSVHSWSLRGTTDDPPSPGIWQALATRNGGDPTGDF